VGCPRPAPSLPHNLSNRHNIWYRRCQVSLQICPNFSITCFMSTELLLLLLILHPAWAVHHLQAPAPCQPCSSELCSISCATGSRGPTTPKGESVSCGDCPIDQEFVCQHEGYNSPDASLGGGVVVAATVREDDEHHNGASEEGAYPLGVGSGVVTGYSTRTPGATAGVGHAKHAAD
jgi:hypothetical protein